MGNIEWQEVQITNFKSFAGTETFTLKSYGPGLHFVQGQNDVEPRLGPNGSGKSSLFDALCWCLYGKTPDGSRNTDVKPWHVKGLTEVIVKLKSNNSKFSILRSTGNVSLLLLNDNPVGQEQLDDLIGLSFEAFTHTILLGQGQPLFFDLAPRDKMQLFSDVLGLERWEVRSKKAGDRVTELGSQSDMTVAIKLGLECSEKDLQVVLDEAKYQSKEWEKEHLKKIKASDTVLKDVTKELEKWQAKSDELEVKYDWACTQVKLVTANLDKLRSQAADLKKLLRQRDELTSFIKNPDLACPTCGQDFDPKEVGRHRVEAKEDLKVLNAEIKDARKAEQEVESLESYLTLRRDEAYEIRANHDLLVKRVANLLAQKNSVEEMLAEREEEANPYRQQIKDIAKRLSEIDRELKDSVAKLAKLDRQIERAKFWVKGFKDVRLYVIEEVLQELELTTNAALEDVGLIGWAVHFDVEKETKSGTMQRGLNVLITSPGLKQRVRWESWSGGEGQRLRVVGSLALSEVLLNHAGVQTSVEIIDEPATFMAPDGVRDLTEFLAARAAALGRSTFLIDHMAIAGAKFASITTVVKDEEGSRIDGPR